MRSLEFSIIVAVFSDDDDSTSKTCLFVLIGWVVFELLPKAPLSELSALRFPKTKSEELVENNEPICLRRHRPPTQWYCRYYS